MWRHRDHETAFSQELAQMLGSAFENVQEQKTRASPTPRMSGSGESIPWDMRGAIIRVHCCWINTVITFWLLQHLHLSCFFYESKLSKGNVLVKAAFQPPFPLRWPPIYPFAFQGPVLSFPSSFTWPGFMAWHLQREERSKGKVQRQTNIRQGIAANLRRGRHTYLRDKIVIKQTDDVLLLDLLGGGDFWRRRHRRPFPQLHASEHTATAQTATPKKTRDRNQVSHKNWRWGKSQPQAHSRVQSIPSEERGREREGLNWNKTKKQPHASREGLASLVTLQP